MIRFQKGSLIVVRTSTKRLYRFFWIYNTEGEQLDCKDCVFEDDMPPSILSCSYSQESLRSYLKNEELFKKTYEIIERKL